jgi:hypothetical protein
MTAKITSQVLSKLFKVVDTFLSSKSEEIYSITTFSVEPGSSQNDNYLSSIYSVKFTTRSNSGENEKKYDLILKSQIITTEKFEDASEYFWNIIFVKEQLTYSVILEKIKELSSILLSPRLHYFYSEGQEYSCLILDNLIQKDYYIPETRNCGLKLEEARLMLKTLAQFHAISLGICNLV